MLGTIIQHEPSFFNGYKNRIRKFATIDELLRIDFVAVWETVYSFRQYSITSQYRKKDYPYALIAEFNSAYPWFIVGYIDENDIIKTLPEWNVNSNLNNNP